MLTLETANYLVGLGSIGLQIAIVGFLALYFLRATFPDLEDIAKLLSRWGLLLAFLLSFGGLIGSLFYSEVLGVAPCGWCWVQRAFLYPQVILFALAIWRRDRFIADYSIALSIVGVIVGVYQHFLQMGVGDAIPCPATASDAVACNVRFLFEFGYITFPLAAASLFGALIVLMLFVRPARA